MTPEQALEKMKAIENNYDQEIAHSMADDILCELLISLGYGELVNEFNRIDKWYA